MADGGIMRKLTPVVVLEEIGPTRDFLEERLGFELVMQIGEDPGADIGAGNPAGFAILQEGGVEVMLQSRGSVRRDVPELAESVPAPGGVGLFVEVEDLSRVRAVAAAPGDAQVTVAERETFYGMREIGLRLPGGVMMMFAQKIDE